jgi:DNA-binding LacI/PurR family transcriptional regulator
MTAVRQPIHEMAATAAKTLLSMLDGKMPSARCRQFACTLDVRDSTGIAPL